MTPTDTNTVQPTTAPTKTAPVASKKVATKKTVPAKAAVKKAATKTVSSKTAKAPAKPTPAAKKTAAPKADTGKAKKTKIIRDKLAFPRDEYGVIALLKVRVGKMGHSAKKSEIIRAGLKAVAALTDQALLKALKSLPSTKPAGSTKKKAK